MRLIFGAISLLIALIAFGLLVKSQLAARFVAPMPLAGKVSVTSGEPLQTETAPPDQRRQIQKIQDQIQQSLDASAQRVDRSAGEQP